MLTARQLKIIKLIMNNPGIHGKEISEQLQVSSRTIRNEITFMNNVTDCALIRSSSNKGYSINEDHLDIIENLMKQDVENIDLAKFRILKIIGKVLFFEDCSIYDLSELLGLSESVIRKEVRKVSIYLRKNYNTELFEIKKDECIVLLNEVEIRELLFKIIKDAAYENPDIIIDILYMILSDAWFIKYYESTKQEILKIMNQEQVYLLNTDLSIFAACIIICNVRNLNGYSLENYAENTPDDLSTRIITKLTMQSSYLDRSDISVLYTLLHTFKFKSTDDKPEITDFTRMVFDEFCNEVFDKYSINFKESETLSNKMLLHIEFMNRRVIGGYELKNPIVDDVKTKFPFAFEISMMIVPILFKYKRVYITEDEISYLTVYVAHFLENENIKLKTLIVTSHRHSVKQLLEQWLSTYFKNQIVIVDKVTKSHCLAMDLSNIDLVITLDSFLILKDVEVFRMDKLPEIKDIERLNATIHNIRMNKRVSKILAKYLPKEHVHIYHQSISLKDVFFDLSEKLHQADIIADTKSFYEDILLREKNYPTYLGANVMVPHALFTFAKKTGIEVAFLKHPIKHQGNQIQLIFLLALEMKRDDEMNLLFQFFNQIVSHEKYMQQLLSSTNCDAFMQNLYSFKLLE